MKAIKAVLKVKATVCLLWTTATGNYQNMISYAAQRLISLLWLLDWHYSAVLLRLYTIFQDWQYCHQVFGRSIIMNFRYRYFSACVCANQSHIPLTSCGGFTSFKISSALAYCKLQKYIMSVQLAGAFTLMKFRSDEILFATRMRSKHCRYIWGISRNWGKNRQLWGKFGH